MSINKIFNVASYNRKESLLKTIDSIYNQADIINIILNLYADTPTELIDSKINIYHKDNSIGASFKFLRILESDGYFFTIDDDLIYPKNYSEYMIDRFNYYDREKIVTLHGRKYTKFPITSYYKSPHTKFHCLGDVNDDILLNVGGSGVMMFHTDLVKMPIDYIKEKNMSDLCISRYANENNIEIMCLKHRSDYLKYQEQPKNTTIYEIYKGDEELRTSYYNTFNFKK
jgi:hypothetical protein